MNLSEAVANFRSLEEIAKRHKIDPRKVKNLKDLIAEYVVDQLEYKEGPVTKADVEYEANAYYDNLYDDAREQIAARRELRDFGLTTKNYTQTSAWDELDAHWEPALKLLMRDWKKLFAKGATR